MAAKLSRFSAMERMMKVQKCCCGLWQRKPRGGKQRKSLASARARCDAGGSRWNRTDADRRKGVVSLKRVPLAMCEKVLGLCRERNFDLNIGHFHEKLKEEHGIELSYTWVRKALQGAGLVAKRSKRGTHRRRRPRRPMMGMLLHMVAKQSRFSAIDGSQPCWFQNSQGHDLIVIPDEATS